MLPSERIRLVLVWVVILAVAGVTILLQSVRPDLENAARLEEGVVAGEIADEGDGAPGSDEGEFASLGAPPLQTELVGKITVALQLGARLANAPTTPEQLLSNAEPLSLPEAPILDRVSYAVLAFDIAGLDEGLAELSRIEPANDLERRFVAAVGKAMELRTQVDAERREDWREDREVPLETTLDEGGRGEVFDSLGAQLGFFARVLDPRDAQDMQSEALRTALVLVGVGSWYALVFLGGLAVLATIATFGAMGKLRMGLVPASDRHRAIVLGETFAIWILLFLVLQVLLAGLGEFLLWSAGDTAISEFVEGPGRLVLSILAFFLSLVVLLYPRVRGISGEDLRELIGLHKGRGLLREAGAGVLCYLAAVPLLAAGMIVFMILTAIRTALFGVGESPSHPAVEMLSGAGALDILLLFLLASVAAPIVEEIVFRGVLYGHLRGVVKPPLRFASFLVAAVASSAIFAAIHPQGVLFVPALGGLAVGFCLFREMRGSLVAPIVAHGINNAVTMTIGLSLFSA